MKRLLLPLIACLFSFMHLSADTQFKQSIGFPDAYAEFLSVCETPDSGYLFFGNTADTTTQVSRLLLVKMDFSGTLLWSKTYSYASDAFGIKVASASNGDIVMMGYTFLNSAPYDDIFLIRAQSNGTIIWSNLYGGNDIDEGNDMIIDAQGNIVIAGYTYSFGTALKSAFLVKTDAGGTLGWSRTYSQNISQEFNGIFQANDNGYILAGFTQAPPGINFDGYMVKTDSAGSLQWSKRTGGPLSEILYKPWQDGSGNYYFAGSASTNTLSGNQDGWLLKVNSTGATNLVNYTYGTSIADRTYSLATLPGGSTLVLSGYAQSNSGFENALFLPVNSADGTLAGSALFAGTLTGNARAMSSFYSTTGLVQGGYIYTASEPLGSAYAVKYATTTSPCQVGIATLDILNQSTGFAYTDSTGSTEGIAAATQSPTTFTPAPVTPGQNIFCIVLDVSIPENENEFSIYPNPVHDVLNLEFPSYREARICITDVNGKKILEKEFQGTKAEISLEGFSPGVYQVVSDNGGVPVKKKFVKIN